MGKIAAKRKLLVVEAHSDDSAISASGFLEKFREAYEMHFLLVTVSDIAMHHCGALSRSERLAEYANYVAHFGGYWQREGPLPIDADARLDTIPKRDIVSAIEATITSVQPDVMIVQGPSFHHDHTIVYEATIAATRPTARHCPSEMYVMENPTYVHSIGPSTDFKPDFYVSLSEEQMMLKLDLFKKCFPSQVREGPNYLSPDGIRAWARYRGIECRRLYAEAFQTYQRVV
jgi:LmbE family N-acetylglucosaminyl deacetylase